MDFFISPSRLKDLREQNKLTVTALSKLLDKKQQPVSTKTISAIEKDKSEKRKVRQQILANLSAGLKISEKVLSGEEPLPDRDAPRNRVELEIDAQTQLNYDLIKRRYSVSIEDVVNVAPVLFIRAAQESLARQKQVLEEEVLDAVKKVDKMPGEPDPKSLDTVLEGFFENVISDEYNLFSFRRTAVDRNDLFNVTVPYEEAANRDPQFEGVNPFAYYLREVCELEIGRNMAEIEDHYFDDFSFISGGPIPKSKVCNENLDQITLGSHEAELALSTGVVRIKDIPEEYWEPRQAGKRVAWLEDEYAAAQKQNELDNDDES